jgi:predicted phage terminase large subunit-like protein
VVYAIYDPARTTLKSSATTGTVVSSWIGRKLVVWEANAQKWTPEEIVNDIFRVNETYRPVAIGFEETGLNEWAMQPIRTEAAKRGVVLPLRALNAPRGKLDFIRSLQPYFRAGEIEFAQDLPDLRQQLLGFPNGHIDAPNALAYMLKIRSGYPIYDEFREEFLAEEMRVKENSPIWLLVNTDNRITTGVLAQHHRGVLSIIADWIMDGDAGTCLKDIVSEARQICPPKAQIRLMAPKRHFDEYSIYGLRAAARAAGVGIARGGDPARGREEIRSLARRFAHGQHAIGVSAAGAGWTLRGFAGGYARDADKVEPQDNAYSLLMEPLEGFAAILKSVSEGLDQPAHYAMTRDGRRYASAFPG